MQPIRQLARILENLADNEHYLFSLQDLRAAIPGQGSASFKALIGRAEKKQFTPTNLSGNIPLPQS